MQKKQLKQHFQVIFKLSQEEDFPQGDITTENLNIESQTALAKLIAKEHLIICGLIFIKDFFSDPKRKVKINTFFKDGDKVSNGDVVCEIKGDKTLILERERIMLNFLQRFSGISSLTHQYVNALKGSGIHLLDTRKTTPGFRYLEKYATQIGGAKNHRMGLSDQYMIKDNHIDAVGSITEAIIQIKAKRKKKIQIEVECKDFHEVKEAVSQTPDMIMLDNMSLKEMKKSIDIIPNTIKTEVSGNITLKRLSRLKNLKIDFISSGAITHSAIAKDLSLRIQGNK